MNLKLGDLISAVVDARIMGPSDVAVNEISLDSRRVVPGSLFACVKGSKVDGASFAGEAAGRGASAILTDRPLAPVTQVTQVIVPDVRRALAVVSAEFFGRPSELLTVVGVTGTNGKTTTVHYVGSIIEASGKKVGIMGTLGHRHGASFTKDSFTTPEAPEVQRYMRGMVDGGVTHCVMEVSSHAIALRRVDQVAFDAVAFTNLTRDHLDFHSDIADYAATKMRLFGIGDEGRAFGAGRKAAINIGDATGGEIRRRTPLDALTFALGAAADLRGDIEELTWQGTRLRVEHRGRTRRVEIGLRGRVNAENALAAYAVGLLLGIDEAAIARGIASLKAVPGRMEHVGGADRQAIVDYAHTPDALRRLLTGVGEMRSGRIICVFGCGGDRDRGKRPQMAMIAAELADLVIVTSDNPRTEDPLKIIEEISEGFPAGAAYEVVPDRAEAIQRAVTVSRPGDVIVVAGKGHEDYQIIGQARIHFDDREVLRRAFGMVTNAKA